MAGGPKAARLESLAPRLGLYPFQNLLLMIFLLFFTKFIPATTVAASSPTEFGANDRFLTPAG